MDNYINNLLKEADASRDTEYELFSEEEKQLTPTKEIHRQQSWAMIEKKRHSEPIISSKQNLLAAEEEYGELNQLPSFKGNICFGGTTSNGKNTKNRYKMKDDIDFCGNFGHRFSKV